MVIAYLGTSLKNNQSHPFASQLSYCTIEELKSVKVSHDEYPMLLDAIHSLDFVDEVTLISTCNRFELVLSSLEPLSLEQVQEIKTIVHQINKSEVPLSYLSAEKARYQILRTYCGLNSGLVGENEIRTQIDIAFKQSYAMSYIKKECMNLLEEATQLRSLVDNYIFREPVSYCKVAMQMSLVRFEQNDFNKIVVLGSGSTAYSVVESLVELGNKAENIHLGHRISFSSDQISSFKANDSFADMSFTRSKYGYHTDKIKELVSDADLLVFAIDSKNPVMSFNQNHKQKIVDFNSRPSCSFSADSDNYISSIDLDAFVRDYSNKRCVNEVFQSRLYLAESMLLDAAVSNSVETKMTV